MLQDLVVLENTVKAFRQAKSWIFKAQETLLSFSVRDHPYWSMKFLNTSGTSDLSYLEVHMSVKFHSIKN